MESCCYKYFLFLNSLTIFCFLNIILFVYLYLFCPQSRQYPSCLFLPLTPNLNFVGNTVLPLPMIPTLCFCSMSFFPSLCFFLLHIICSHIFKCTLSHYKIAFIIVDYEIYQIIFFCLFFWLQGIKYFFGYIWLFILLS